MHLREIGSREIDPHEIQSTLTSAVEEVLETMCFAAVLGSAEGVGPPGSDGASELSFKGCPSGGFSVIVPDKLARALGAGFLGREEAEVSASQAGEVVCELANMICGSVLSRLESAATFQISHPELAPPEHRKNFETASANRWFDLGGGVLTVSLHLREAA